MLLQLTMHPSIDMWTTLTPSGSTQRTPRTMAATVDLEFHSRHTSASFIICSRLGSFHAHTLDVSSSPLTEFSCMLPEVLQYSVLCPSNVATLSC